MNNSSQGGGDLDIDFDVPSFKDKSQDQEEEKSLFSEGQRSTFKGSIGNDPEFIAAEDAESIDEMFRY